MNGNAPLDVNGLSMAWPNRDGRLTIPNGAKLAMKYWTIEISFKCVNNTQAQAIPLNNAVQGFLLNSFFWTIEAYSAASIALSPTGGTLIPQGTLNSAYITLYDNKSFVFWNLKPMRDLQTINDTATKFGKQYADSLEGQVINWQNSQIYLADTSAMTNGDTYSILLGLSFSQYSNPQMDGVGTSNPNQIEVNNQAGN
jgi:hypothetical protein